MKYSVIAPFSPELSAALANVSAAIRDAHQVVAIPDGAPAITIEAELVDANAQGARDEIRVEGDTRLDRLTGGANRVFGAWRLADEPIRARFVGIHVVDRRAPALGGEYAVVGVWESTELDEIRRHFAALAAVAPARAARHADLHRHGARLIRASGPEPDESMSAAPRLWARWPLATVSGDAAAALPAIVATATAAAKSLPPWARLESVQVVPPTAAPIKLL